MARHYHLNPETGVHFIADAPAFGYSDGDALEDALLKFIRTAKDRSSSSAELAAGIVDWPTYYHLSWDRGRHGQLVSDPGAQERSSPAALAAICLGLSVRQRPAPGL